MRVARMHIACSAGLLVCVSGCAGTLRPASALAPQRDPARAAALSGQALALLSESRFAESAALLEQALRSDPFCGVAYNNLGIAQLRLEKPFEAAHSFQNAARLLPRSSAPRANLGLLLERAGDFESAEENFRAALRDSPDDIQIVGYLARLHARQNRHTPETRSWLQIVAAQENDPAWRSWAQKELSRQPAVHTEQGSSP